MGQGILCGRDDAGLELHTCIGQRGSGRGQLEHGEGVVTLPNAQRNGFSAVPFFLLGFLVITALPVSAGQDATHFPGQINAGDLAKAQWLHEVVDRIDAHLVGERVVVHVAGQHDGAHHVHSPQTAVAMAAESVPAIGP